MLAEVELRHLRYFTAVAEEQNVTRAAARLHVSQPPLSRQIRDLEEELGVQLFKRTAKSIELTEAGTLFLAEARAVLNRADEAVQAVRALARGTRGQVRIGYAPSLTVEILPRALRRFEMENPGARVVLRDCSTGECVGKVLDKKLDLALGPRPAGKTASGLVFEKLAEFSLCCVIAEAHPLSKKRFIHLRELQSERLIGYSQEDYPEYHEWLAELFRPFGFQPSVAEEHDSVTSLIAAVEAGRGVAIAPSSLRCLTGPRLKFLPICPPPPRLIVGAIYCNPPAPLAGKFIAALK